MPGRFTPRLSRGLSQTSGRGSEQRFPDLDDGVVEAAVRVAHSELTGRVRDFVPVLVERVARERLSSAHRAGTLASEA